MNASPIDSRALADIVALACRAPSLHNSQPWHLRAQDGELRLFLDARRAPRYTDPTGRELVISCGALLDHLRVAAQAGGYRVGIDRFPNPNDLDHLATLRFHRTEMVTDAERARADAILQRRSDRLPFAAPADWALIEPFLRNAVDPDDATLSLLPASARPRLAEASRLTEALRRYDHSYQAELQWWTAPFEVSEGVPRSSLPATSEPERTDVARRFPIGAQSGLRPEVQHDRAVIAVLSTDSDDRHATLRCGEALSAVLLEATVAGLATCPLTHITETGASRAILADLTGGAGDPQILVRIGQVPALADQPPATPRRPLADVLSVEPAPQAG